jgi:hypothetical protein
MLRPGNVAAMCRVAIFQSGCNRAYQASLRDACQSRCRDPWALLLTHISTALSLAFLFGRRWRRNPSFYPNGIAGNQPGVARNAPPWVRRPKELLVTLKRVAAVTEDFGQGLPRRPRVSLRLTQPISGLMSANDALPRVARRALPWAERLHPFRITHGRILTLLVQPQPRGKDVGNDKRLQPHGYLQETAPRSSFKTSKLQGGGAFQPDTTRTSFPSRRDA